MATEINASGDETNPSTTLAKWAPTSDKWTYNL